MSSDLLTDSEVINSLTRYGIPDWVALEALEYPINAGRELLNLNNCYSYAVGDLFLHGLSEYEMGYHNYMPWIGESTGIRRTKWNIKRLNRDVVKYATDDEAEFIGPDKPADYKPGFVQIFLACNYDGIGHVYRQHSDETWSHKSGPGARVTGFENIRESRNIIKNPFTCYRGDYVCPVGFFRFPVGTQIGIKAYENKLHKNGGRGDVANFISETQPYRDACAELNIKMEQYAKGKQWFGGPNFLAIHDEYLRIKDGFKTVVDKYKNTVTRHKLLTKINNK